MLGVGFPRLLDVIAVKQILYEATSAGVMVSVRFNQRCFSIKDLLREWQCVCGVEVIDRPAAFTQILACLDASLDIPIGFADSFRHAHTGREVACNGG
jgi:hypothetical protein